MGAPRKSTCLIGQALVELEEPYQSALRNIISTPYDEGGLTDFEAAIVMTEAGLGSSQSSVSRHRRNLCVCRQRGRNE